MLLLPDLTSRTIAYMCFDTSHLNSVLERDCWGTDVLTVQLQ